MKNQDVLIRLRYALDIKDTDMAKIFHLGGVSITKEDLQVLLSKPDQSENFDEDNDLEEDNNICSNRMLESFLNGFIIFKRGARPACPGEPVREAFTIKSNRSVNNVVLKKLKIALAFTGDQMLDTMKAAGCILSNSELSAVLRKEGQRNYKECGDRYVRAFLKGLAVKLR